MEVVGAIREVEAPGDHDRDTARQVAAHDGDAESLIDRLRAVVANFADGATQDDDMTAVVVRRIGE